MKNPHFCCHKGEGKPKRKFKHQKGPHMKNYGNDEKQLLFELFKHFLKTRLDGEQRNQESHQEENSQVAEQCQASEEVEIVNSDEEHCERPGRKQKHCGKFGPFKRGKHHKHWGKHHHGHHKMMGHHGPHHHHPHHGMHHHHGFGGHHKC
ncbi:histidine-rich glycoprotein-like [Harmonia axyridis]|uniref:histidine-rich glycoprotein-like n=1 Tax=Harmonia axyridis TaxID=115357 RepID=UPI001E27609F|nr:histidine-rich glycoprotein-like [Harmonia axyridis]